MIQAMLLSKQFPFKVNEIHDCYSHLDDHPKTMHLPPDKKWDAIKMSCELAVQTKKKLKVEFFRVARSLAKSPGKDEGLEHIADIMEKSKIISTLLLADIHHVVHNELQSIQLQAIRVDKMFPQEAQQIEKSVQKIAKYLRELQKYCKDKV